VQYLDQGAYNVGDCHCGVCLSQFGIQESIV